MTPCRHAPLALALLALLPRLAAAQAAPAPAAPESAAPGAPTPPDLTAGPRVAGAVLQFDTEVGAQVADVRGSREKLFEYGRLNEGLVLDSLRVRYQRPQSGHFLELDLRNASQDDEALGLALGRRGRYRLSATYEAVPHRFTGGTFLFGGFGTGRLRIADVAQEQLQANEADAVARGGPPPAGDPTVPVPLDLEQQRIVNGLYAAAPGVSFGLDRRRLAATLEGSPWRDLRVWARVQNENRTGARVVGTGSYERWQDGSGAAHTVDRFIALGAELAEPLDYRTFGLAAGAGLARETWSADAEYTVTIFRNFEGVLRWDNPFRATDAAQVGAVDRSRFAVGQLVLPPDSVAHDVTLSGRDRPAAARPARRERELGRDHAGRRVLPVHPEQRDRRDRPRRQPGRPGEHGGATRPRSRGRRAHPRGDALGVRPAHDAADRDRALPRVPLRRPVRRDRLPRLRGLRRVRLAPGAERPRRRRRAGRAGGERGVRLLAARGRARGRPARLAAPLRDGRGGLGGLALRPPARGRARRVVRRRRRHPAAAPERVAPRPLPVLRPHELRVPQGEHAGEPRGARPHELQLVGSPATPRRGPRAVGAAPRPLARPHRPPRGRELRRRDRGRHDGGRVQVRPHRREGLVGLGGRDRHAARAALAPGELHARPPQGAAARTPRRTTARSPPASSSTPTAPR